MSLRSQLQSLLTEVLPTDPADAIKGTDLIRVVKLRIDGEYSDASLRYHFSVMSCDPASPIAKVEKGQGYYRRSAQLPPLTGAREVLSLTQSKLKGLNEEPDNADQTILRNRKFRAVVVRYFEENARFPFIFSHAFQHHSPIENFWKFPDAVLVDWGSNADFEDELLLDPGLTKQKQQLGLPAYEIAGLRLRIHPNHANCREDFFQTLAACAWTQASELIYACPIEDEALADLMRRLGNTYGVGITTFGLTTAVLDELPRPAHILNAHPNATEAIFAKLDFQRLTTATHRPHIDWKMLQAIRSDARDLDQLFTWLNQCLEDQRVVSPHNPANSPLPSP